MATSQGRLQQIKKDLTQNKTLLIMLMPAVAFFVVFNYIPMFGILIAFKQYNFASGILGSPWAGFKNFEYLFKSGDALNVARNTVLYNLAFILIGNFFQITSAIVLSQLASKWFKKITQSFMFLPYIMSWVVVGAVSYNLFGYNSGLVNQVLKALGKDSVDIYNQASLWPFIIVAFDTWKNIGYGCVLYLAAIMGIDHSLYEAAEIDGAGLFQRIRVITIPLMTPTIIILILLSVGNIFKGNFQEFYQLVGNNPILLEKTDVIETYVTRSLLQMNDFGMSSAAGVFQSVLGFATIMIVNYAVRSYEKDYALF